MAILPSLYDDSKMMKSVPMNPFSDDSTLVYDREKGGGRWNLLNELIGVTIIDLHPQLRKAWKRVASLPEAKRAELMKSLTAPMITESEAEELSVVCQKNRAEGRRLAQVWMCQARLRWESIEGGGDR
jgi:hypothetical protein